MHAPPISPAPALESTPIPVSAPSAAPSVIPATGPGVPIPRPQELAPVVEVSDSLDPLSHLTHIFEKIRKQVIEWGEDANWKIDVFLLPNEDGTASTPGLAMGSDTQLLSPAPPPASAPRIDLTDSPRRQVKEIKDVDKGHATKALGFELQPPPNDLPFFTKEKILSLKETDISSLSESEAKRMLSLATRQLHEQREFTSRVMHDLDSLQRISARRERDAEARLDAERRLIERDNVILSRKWEETSRLLKERDREIQDVHMQLETGKRIIMERNEDRRKRVDEHGSIQRTPPGQHNAPSAAQLPSTSSRSEDQQRCHQHRHRHIHYHRHHHKPRRGNESRSNDAHDFGTDSLENLALLASQVLSREPLPVSQKATNAVVSDGSLNSTALDEQVISSEKRKIPSQEIDKGLQLRPVKRPELNGTGTGAEESASRPERPTPSGLSNGAFISKTISTHQQGPHQQVSPSSLRSSGTSGAYHRAGTSGTRHAGLQDRPSNKQRRS
ncbi:hypothetical protein BGZ50_000103 [Haplosporangium sp. Z 11]|nr:hypothetical protein BGZ50_000103 [Haplosporangium sp. Z 11]